MIKKGKTVQQAKRLGIIGCSQAETLETAANRMVEEDLSSLVIIDGEGFLSGILTRTDLLRAYMELEDWRERPVSDYMITEVVTVSPQDLLSTAADLLLEKGIHRVVVVEADEQARKRPVAVLSAADLVYHMTRSEGNRWMRGSE